VDEGGGEENHSKERQQRQDSQKKMNRFLMIQGSGDLMIY
jgi:hypothetical protein